MSLIATIYGIPNCDTVRKARKWLENEGVEHAFHDVRSNPLPLETLQHWADQVGIDTLVNKRSTSWRQLDPQQQQADTAELIQLLQDHPTLMKRPVLVIAPTIIVGFNENNWREAVKR